MPEAGEGRFFILLLHNTGDASGTGWMAQLQRTLGSSASLSLDTKQAGAGAIADFVLG